MIHRVHQFTDRIVNFFHTHAAQLYAATILLIVGLGIVVRLQHVQYPTNLEVYRDFLVSDHIAHYGDYPLTGPSNSIAPALRNSPTYYYFWAIFAAIKPHVLFLQVINILLQGLTVLCLALLAQRLFGRGTALITAVLFSLNGRLLTHSIGPWQPFTMEPFLYLSFLWLWTGYARRSYGAVLAALALFIFAGSFHYAAYALGPVFVGITIWIAWTNRWKLAQYVGMATALFGTFILCFIGPYIRFHQNAYGAVSGKVFVNTVAALGTNFWHNCVQFTYELFPDAPGTTIIRYTLIGVTLAAAVVYGIGVQRGWIAKRFAIRLAVLSTAILLPLVATAFLSTPVWGYYFIPVLGLFAMVIAELIHQTLFRGYVGRVAEFVVVGWLVAATMVGLPATGVAQERHQFEQATERSMNLLSQEIMSLMKQRGTTNPDFFQIKLYHAVMVYPDHPAWIWYQLEQRLHHRLITIEDAGNSYTSLNTDEYVFVVCLDLPTLAEQQQHCLQPFKNDSPGYTWVKPVSYEYPFVIYEMRKTQLVN